MMWKRIISCLAIGVCVPPALADEPPDFSKIGRPFLETHCIDCHSGTEPKGELRLDEFRETPSVVKQRKIWEKIVKVVQSGEMPPEDRPQPKPEDVEAFVVHIKGVFDDADRRAPPDPGRVTMRRLNRTEYRNTIRDLLLVDFDPTENFPEDDVGHGFDNIGDVLSLSPLLMERYLEAAESIANRVIMVNPPAPARRYLAGRFLQPNNAETSQGRFRLLDPNSEEAVHSGPFMASGDYLKFSADAELILRANLYAETNQEGPVNVALFLIGKDLDGLATPEDLSPFLGANAPKLTNVKILKTFEITARGPDNPQQIEFPVYRMGNIQNAGVALLKPPEGQEPAKLHIEHIWSEGPLETRPASHLKLLACTPNVSQADQTREVLTRLLRHAYRRPPSSEELERLAKHIDEAVAAGEKWEAGIQQALQIVLCSPKFLFRVELDDRPQSPEPQPLDEFQLASRLSYFLWSSMPDDELLDLADQNQLTEQLSAQVRRMLASPKSGEFVRNFALQWLQVQRLERFTPDAALFPSFNEPLRASMLKETELFFDSVMREDRSIFELLDANYTYLNEPLAQHYGIIDTKGNIAGQDPVEPGGMPITGPEFQRVDLQGKRRGGLLTQASVLTVTSNPTRTSPVKRGRWVLEQILGEPPPPPPPNVPELPNDEQAVATGSLRQRMEIHRKNPACANCHAKMDPIGFSLENFDAIGKFRLKEGEFDVDATGDFPDGTTFTGPDGLKEILSQKNELFARCLAEKMLTYALGRGLEYYDKRAVDKIVTGLAAEEYKFSALVTSIVTSEPFRLRRGGDASE
ncbi:MAG: DUF1592 domain-containing protein [Planctomycetota bacterium]|nr:DUF1592 domain-containing protein [Planctomycetota bacterium]MDA1213155.1 DUF1592 domain-containing protein [Planctomycetota bacterium]